MELKTIFDFIHAALPWIAIGLLLAVFFARKTSAKNEKETDGDYGIEGMCLGMCLGSAIGAAGVVTIGIGISFGMLIGLVIGTFIQKEEKEE